MVQKFLDMVRNDPRTQELAKALPAPKSDEEAVEIYARLAKELGFDLTADEILAGLKGMEQEQKTQTEKVSLEDDDLENVAGGITIQGSRSNGNNCFLNDSCSFVIKSYEEPDMLETVKAPAECLLNDSCSQVITIYGVGIAEGEAER